MSANEYGGSFTGLSWLFHAVPGYSRLFQAFSHFLAFVHLPLLPCSSVLMAAERDTSITLAKVRVFERQKLFQCISHGLYSGENFLRSLILLGKRSAALGSLSREKWPRPFKRRMTERLQSISTDVTILNGGFTNIRVLNDHK